MNTDLISDEYVNVTVPDLEIDDLRSLANNLDTAQRALEVKIDELDAKISSDAPTYVGDTVVGAEDLMEEQAPLLALKEAVDAQVEAVRARIEDDEWIVIDGEIIDVDRTHDAHDECPAMIEDGRRDWYVDDSSESAGVRARARWESLAENDPKEFTCMVGEETLVQWGLGRYAGPGSTKVKSLEEWLDLHLDTPEEEFAGYDGAERIVDFCSEALEATLGFKPTVAYRHN